MSLDIITASQLEPYNDEEEIQLMDTDQTNLQLDEPSLVPPTDVVHEQKTDYQTDEEKDKVVPSLLVIEVGFIIKKHNQFIYLFIIET